MTRARSASRTVSSRMPDWKAISSSMVATVGVLGRRPALSDCAGIGFGAQGFNQIGKRLGAEVAFAAVAKAGSAGFGLFGADHEHVGNFLELRVANFCRELFVAVVEMHADAVILEHFVNVLRVVDHLFADGTDFDLYWRQPERKCSGVVLDQDTEEAFDGTEQRAVHHQWLVASAIVADIFQAEARWQVEIELNSGELPGAADGVD